MVDDDQAKTGWKMSGAKIILDRQDQILQVIRQHGTYNAAYEIHGQGISEVRYFRKLVKRYLAVELVKIFQERTDAHEKLKSLASDRRRSPAAPTPPQPQLDLAPQPSDGSATELQTPPARKPAFVLPNYSEDEIFGRVKKP